jgi:tetratricopeptide (TPR) repeat protein
MDKEELLDRYEATLDEGTYLEARRLYEAALAETADDARLLFEYGYLQECHGRNSLRAAISSYQRAIELDPEWAKPRLQLIVASAALLQTDTAIALYKRRLAAAPDDLASTATSPLPTSWRTSTRRRRRWSAPACRSRPTTRC